MKDFLRNNGILILIIAVLLSLITAVLSFTFGGGALPIANLTGVLATPFRNGFNAFANWSEGVYSDAFQRENMATELDELRAEVAQLRQEAVEVEAIKKENERLRNLNALSVKRPDFDKEDAKVTAHGSFNWTATLTVDKGSAADVAAGDCVVDEYGYLVGVVSEVGLNWSTVRTVVDVDLEMGGRIARTGAAAILEGDFRLMEEDRLKLTYLPADGDILPGDAVVTSGLKSGNEATYPAGLVVGYVEELRADEGGMNNYAVLTPASKLNSLEQVFIIRDFRVIEE